MNSKISLLALPLLALAAPGLAEPTEVTVRIISQDAKFVGTSMGGVTITLSDGQSGEVLAQGLTEGGTGDTALIMNSEGRSPLRATDDAAAFSTTLDIEQPTLVNLQAHGPENYPQSAIYVSQQRWVMPGEDVTAGGGWIVELPGLVIAPDAVIEGRDVAVSAKVSPMCGCPIAPGGLWPAEEYVVTASLWQDGRQVAEAGMDFASAPGNYEGRIPIPDQGEFELVLFAKNTRSGNSGLVRVPLTAGN
jgi:hypothetical protein